MAARQSTDPARAKAVVRFTLLVVPAVLAVGAVLVYLFVADNGFSEDEAVFAAVAALVALFVYEAVLVFTVLLPGLKGSGDAG